MILTQYWWFPIERYVKALKVELETCEQIEDLDTSKRRVFSLLLKVQELTQTSERVSATVLRQECGMDTHYFHVIRDWLVAHGYLAVDKQGRQRWITVSEIGVDGLARRDMVMRLEEHSKRLYDVKSFEEEMEGLNHLFGEIFDYSWKRLKRFRDLDDYYLFLGAVEGSAYQHLNAGVAEQIERIKKGDLRGYLSDPYFSVERRFLPASFFDAALARKLGHFLTYNHGFLLVSSGDVTEDELRRHNRDWAKRFMGEEMPGEDELNAHTWRLIPRFTVRREREKRGDHQLLPEHARLCNRKETATYKDENPAFYERNQRLYNHDGFQENPLWSIDQKRAIENYEARNLKREADRSGITSEILAEMKSLAAYKPRYVVTTDGVIAEYYTEKDELIKSLKIK